MPMPQPIILLVASGLLGLLILTAHFARLAHVRSGELRRAHGELQNLSARLLRVQDEERRRIARELHDSTSQMLGAAAISVERAQRMAQTSDYETLGHVLRESADLLNRVTLEIRTSSYLLHPPMLDEIGLEYALPSYAEGFSNRSGISVSLNIQPDLGRLPRDVELTLFRIAQEALTNIHHHSGSRTAFLTLLRDASSAILEIKDEGRGFSPGALESIDGRLGVGITGMRERVRQLGGHLEIASDHRGTAIRAVLPLAA